MSLVLDCLRNGKTVEELAATYHLSVWRSATFPGLISLKYRQHESPLDNPFVQQCRGMIVDSENNWKVIARPFDKFFNAGEPNAPTIHWKTAKILEKEDGTLCFLYYHDPTHQRRESKRGGWHIGTTGCGDASGQIRKGATHYNKDSESSITYAELFWKVFDELDYQLPTNKEITYIFELTSPLNQLVVLQDCNHLKFLGARENTEEGLEFLAADAKTKFQLNYETVKEYPCSTELEEKLSTTKNLTSLINILHETFGEESPLKREGFVIVDEKFNRVKVKNPAHVAIQHLGDGHLNAKNFLAIVQSAEEGEFLAHFPQYAKEIEPIQSAYNAFVRKLEDQYSGICDLPKKQFQTEAYGTTHPECMIALRHGTATSVKDYLRSLPPLQLLKLLNISAAKTKPRKRRNKNKKKK